MRVKERITCRPDWHAFGEGDGAHAPSPATGRWAKGMPWTSAGWGRADPRKQEAGLRGSYGRARPDPRHGGPQHPMI